MWQGVCKQTQLLGDGCDGSLYLCLALGVCDNSSAHGGANVATGCEDNFDGCGLDLKAVDGAREVDIVLEWKGWPIDAECGGGSGGGAVVACGLGALAGTGPVNGMQLVLSQLYHEADVWVLLLVCCVSVRSYCLVGFHSFAYAGGVMCLGTASAARTGRSSS